MESLREPAHRGPPHPDQIRFRRDVIVDTLILGFFMVFVASIAGGAFGLQYRIMRVYTVENASLLSVFFATVPIPLVACTILLPGWTGAIADVGWRDNLVVFIWGFCWGLGAITYAYGFSILGMALASALLKGITIAIGSGIPLIRHWDQVASAPRTATIVGLLILIGGTAFAGKAGIMREREMRADPKVGGDEDHKYSITIRPTGKMFWLGLLVCLFSGIASSGANVGFDRADVIEKAMVAISHTSDLTWRATLIRWMPMYWGGITAIVIFMGGSMLLNGNWKNYFAKGSMRDCLISSSMGFVHFLAQIPYGIGAYYLGKLGTTVGWGANIGMMLIVATAIGFMMGEWKGTTRPTFRMVLTSIVVLIIGMGVLAYANSLVQS